jgi:hypothetical protein
MPQKRECAAERDRWTNNFVHISAELTSSCGGHDTKMRELEGGALEMVADGTRWRWRGREGQNETAEQGRGKKPCNRDAEMLEFGIKRASCTQAWGPTSRRAPLQFASILDCDEK